MKLSLLSRIGMTAAAVLALGSLTFAQEPATTIAITHAKIFTLAGAPIDDGVLVIKDGKIATTYHMENWLSALAQLRAK